MTNKSNFYKDNLPRLIAKYKLAMENCLVIAGNAIDDSLGDEKIFNALKGRKEAGEQFKFYAKEIESLENEINDVCVEEKVEKTGAERYSKK